MSEYFAPNEICPKSREILQHNTITTVRCGRCEKLNTNYEESPVKLPTRGRANPFGNQEIIKIEDSPPIAPSKATCRARDHGQATHIPGITDFKVGYAEKERQSADRRIADRKPKSGFIGPVPIVHFQVSVAHLRYNEDRDDAGTWKILGHTFIIDEPNRELTSEHLKDSILAQARTRAKRGFVQPWLSGDDVIEESNWALGHSNPKKDGGPREIAPWSMLKLLSTVIQEGTYTTKKIGPDQVRLVSIWLYYIPELLPQPEIKLEPKIKREKKVVKKEKDVKVEQKVKVEWNVKSEPLILKKKKRPASSDLSGPSKTRMMTRAITRGANFVGAGNLSDSDNVTFEEARAFGQAQVYGTADVFGEDSEEDNEEQEGDDEGQEEES